MNAQQVANYLLAALTSGGLQRYFIAPGSRSQALAIAAHKLEAAGRAKTTVRLDERSLGFTALGSALASEKPVALIVTSGTAVGNLMPAVLEAKHAGVRLIVLSADRPDRLRATGANQTLDQQSGIFGYAADAFNISLEASETELAELARRALQVKGPVQLNIEFDLPLSDGTLDLPNVSLELSRPESTQDELEVPIDNSTVVIAGAGGAAAAEFAELANLPLIAEPNSGARTGSAALNFPLQAIEQNREQIKRAVVFGKPTLSRAVQSLLSSCEVWLCEPESYPAIHPAGRILGRAGKLIPVGQAEDWWPDRFLVSRELDSREEFVSFVWNHSGRLFLGASDLIRDLDQVANPKAIEVYSNRGLSGIDGTVSTAIGVALEKGETTLLLGDLTLLHDAAGLNQTDLGSLPLRIVVGNDNGGHIFSRLEVAKELPTDQLERLFLTPQQVDLSALAGAYGWSYQLCNSLVQLESAWQLSGPVLIDYRL